MIWDCPWVAGREEAVFRGGNGMTFWRMPDTLPRFPTTQWARPRKLPNRSHRGRTGPQRGARRWPCRLTRPPIPQRRPRANPSPELPALASKPRSRHAVRDPRPDGLALADLDGPG